MFGMHRDRGDRGERRFARDEFAGGFGRGRHGPDREGGRGGPGGGGPRGLGRFFAHGDLRLVILALLAEKPRHGYEIIKEIEERVAGAYSPSPGVIYPTLTMLEELGQITVEAAEGKKLNAITAEGTAFLDANRRTLEAILGRMDEANRMRGGGPAPQILRAMENLKLALRMRMGRGPLTTEQVAAIAAALDAAATSVEGS